MKQLTKSELMYEYPDILKISHLSIAKERVRQIDRNINTYLHLLEDLSLSGVDMIKIAAKLRDTRRERRYWKELTHLIDKIGESATKNLMAWVGCKKSRKERYTEESKNNYEIFVDKGLI